MTYRRDWQLQQLGITQMMLKRPAALQQGKQGKIAISYIPAHIRLVMIAEEPVALNDTLISDVLRTLRISHDQVIQLTPDRVAMLLPHSSSCCNSWQIGVTVETVEMMINGSTIASPALDVLKNNPTERSRLWQQICKYENNFFRYD